MLPSHGVYSASSPASFASCNSKEAITTLAQPAADTQMLKHYHFDWNVVPDPGARFENLVASHLHFVSREGIRVAPATKILLEKKDRSASSARSQPSAPADCVGL